MTEYDYSPEAYDRYMQKQVKIGQWVDRTNRYKPADPSTAATPAPDVSAPLPLDGGEDEDLSQDTPREREKTDDGNIKRDRRRRDSPSRDRDRNLDKDREPEKPKDRGRDKERERDKERHGTRRSPPYRSDSHSTARATPSRSQTTSAVPQPARRPSHDRGTQSYEKTRSTRSRPPDDRNDSKPHPLSVTYGATDHRRSGSSHDTPPRAPRYPKSYPLYQKFRQHEDYLFYDQNHLRDHPPRPHTSEPRNFSASPVPATPAPPPLASAPAAATPPRSRQARSQSVSSPPHPHIQTYVAVTSHPPPPRAQPPQKPPQPRHTRSASHSNVPQQQQQQQPPPMHPAMIPAHAALGVHRLPPPQSSPPVYPYATKPSHKQRSQSLQRIPVPPALHHSHLQSQSQPHPGTAPPRFQTGVVVHPQRLKPLPDPLKLHPAGLQFVQPQQHYHPHTAYEKESSRPVLPEPDGSSPRRATLLRRLLLGLRGSKMNSSQTTLASSGASMNTTTKRGSKSLGGTPRSPRSPVTPTGDGSRSGSSPSPGGERENRSFDGTVWHDGGGRRGRGQKGLGLGVGRREDEREREWEWITHVTVPEAGKGRNPFISGEIVGGDVRRGRSRRSSR